MHFPTYFVTALTATITTFALPLGSQQHQAEATSSLRRGLFGGDGNISDNTLGDFFNEEKFGRVRDNTEYFPENHSPEDLRLELHGVSGNSPVV